MDTVYIMSFLQEAPLPIGKQDLDIYSPHVTFLPKVNVTENQLNLLQEHVDKVAKRTKRFTLKPTQTAFFGADQNIKVHLLDDVSNDGVALHLNLLAAAFKSGVHSSEAPNYIGLDFSPHISLDHSSESQGWDEHVEITSITLVIHKEGFGVGDTFVIKHFNLL